MKKHGLWLYGTLDPAGIKTGSMLVLMMWNFACVWWNGMIIC
jgi:hypothetical protein